MFERRGVPYRVDDDARVTYFGDPSSRTLLLEPALDALRDPRMAGARAEFEDALIKLGVGRSKDREDAIEESRKAVESAMKATLQAHGEEGPSRKTTWPLVEALRDAGIVEAETDNLSTAAARIANAGASHGAGTEPRDVPHELAAAAVCAAANAITFLTMRLPGEPA
jgi:HEPN domain-containing protein